MKLSDVIAMQEELEAANMSQYGDTGWQYGKRALAPAAGYLPTRSLAGFPTQRGPRFPMRMPTGGGMKGPRTPLGRGTATGMKVSPPKVAKMVRPTTPKTFHPTMPKVPHPTMPKAPTVSKAHITAPGSSSSGWNKKTLSGEGTKPKCPYCGSSKYSLMPTDFETAKCKKCGKTWNHGIVPGINSPKKLEAMEGEPIGGAFSTAHIDPVLWFRPPSLTQREKGSPSDHRVPVDQPGEKNNKWLDVTKRHSKDTEEFRMGLLKKKGPGGAPPQIPVRTTLINPHSASYMPGMQSAAENRMNRRVRSGNKGQFTSYSRRGCI